MKVSVLAAVVLAVGLTACEQGRQAGEPQGSAQGQAQAAQQGQGSENQDQGEVVTVQGCLSSGGENGFILTAEPGDLVSGMVATSGGTVRTVTYQLVVRDPAELQELIGQQVEVRGRADEEPRTSAEMSREKETTATPVEEGVTPKVETKEKAEIDVKKLSVISYRAAGGACPEDQR